MAKQGQMRLRVALQNRSVAEEPPVRGNQIKAQVAIARFHLMRLRARGIKPVTQAEVFASALKANSEAPRLLADLAEYARRTEQHTETTGVLIRELLLLEQAIFQQGR